MQTPEKIDPRPGPPTVLNKEEEQNLVKWIIQSSKKGFPKRKEDLQYSVSKFLKDSNRKNPFKDNMPGEKWLMLFLKRHPEVRVRCSEAVTAASSTVAEKDIRGWFKEIEKYLKDSNLFYILSDPVRVLNGDETNFLLCPKTGTVLAEKGEKNVYEVDRGQAKSAITVMFTFAANGTVTPPMIIFPYKRLPSDIAAKVPSDWGIGLSDNGWMKADLFYDYIKNVLHPYLMKEKITFPVILFVDGHKTHMTLQVSELCSELQIVLIALYPNSTRILQPADVSAFFPLKCAYRKSVLEWRREHPSQALTKIDFVPILQKAIASGIKPTTIQNGFKACGLHPWDPNSVNFNKCLGAAKVSSPKTIETEIVTQSRECISKKTFIDTVGLDVIETIEKKDNLTKLETVLKNLWNIFKKSTGEEKFNGTEQNNRKLITELKVINEKEKNEDKENIDIEKLDVIFADDEPSQSLLVSSDVHSVDVHNTELDYLRRLHSANKSSNIQETDVNEDKTHEIALNRLKKHDLKDQYDYDAITTEDDTNEKRKQLNIFPVKLQDILVLPKTPRRKGTRDSERVSFVLTSAEWQRRENEKKLIKQEKEEAVKKRKEVRELKKNIPKIPKPKKNESKEKKKALAAVKKQLFSQEFYNIVATPSSEEKPVEDVVNSLDYDLNAEKDDKIYTDAEIERMLTDFRD